MRILGLILTVAAGTLWIASAGAQDSAKPSSPRDLKKPTAKVKELQQERIDTLKTVVEVETALFKIGKAPPEAVLEARVLLSEAQWDAAEDAPDRITALKSLVEVLKELEEAAKAWKRAARVSEAAVLKVKARRLEAEIRLEQVQGEGHAKKVESEREKVVVTSLQVKDVVIAERFACQIHARRHIEVRSQQSGYLEEIEVKEGQAVKKGEVMFRIAPLLYKTKLDAELAEVELALLNLKSTEKLVQNKVISENEAAQSKAKLTGAQARAKLAQAELDLTVIRAPFDGIMGRMPGQPGSLVMGHDVLTTLSDNEVMWVYFNVPQTRYIEYVSQPAKDQEVEVELVLADGRKYSQPGRIAAIEAQFDEVTGNIAFRADFPNPDALLRHGMAGNLLLHRTLKSAVVVPQRATFEVLGQRYVYVVDKEDVAHQREIVIQSELPDEFVVTKGIEANDRIVIEGVRQVHDNEKLEYELRKP